jgi:membrane protein insertase Oxa1/YidC/SpoIIIJ
MALMTSVLFFVMFIQYKWSSAFVLYWFALNLLSIYQQYEYIYKPHKARQSAEAAGGALAAAAGSGVVIESDSISAGSSTDRPRVRPRRKKR